MSVPAPSGPDKTTDAKEAEKRKTANLDHLEDRHASLILELRRALLRAILERGQASIDDVRDSALLPATANPTLLGAVPKSLTTLGIITQGGFIKSTRPEAHGRPVSIWKIANREAALKWLEEHSSLGQQPAAAAGSQSQTATSSFPSSSAGDRHQGTLFDAGGRGYYG